ncbi:ABC-type transporter, periplasmic subunit [Thalassoporum mexicanum PCC 7367]|uniref:ABC transporter substrate-binding protein n=1 Tax=Thalassoporum mexicanum TaxID=3457544 RepID=UPI00029FDDE8|nr:iron-siderophore ABC transporter substrate-binding protein [Pseudanabaena sp. PCC 7367]AFY71446.1 ABC-type transporter, periplasmic subunit [Pseudanabaena sp. PCC 7367]
MKFSVSIRLLVSVMLVGAIAACQPAQSDRPATDETANESNSPATPDCRLVEHDAGETEICGQPQRVVALGPYALEPLLALEIQPIAFADHISLHQGDYDQPSQQIPYLGKFVTQPIANVGLAYNPSLESILQLKPDLIVGAEGSEAQYTNLSEIAPTILVSWSEPKASLEIIGQAVDRPEQAKQILQVTEQRIANAKENFAPLVATRPQMLLLGSSELQEIFLANYYGMCGSLLEELGFELLTPAGLEEPQSDSHSIPVSIETLPQLNDADLVLLLGNNFTELEQLDGLENFEAHQLAKLKQAWLENPIAQSLDASKTGQVYFIPVYICVGLPGVIGAELYLDELEQHLLTTQ